MALGDFQTVAIPNANDRWFNPDGSPTLAAWMFLQGLQIAVPSEGATPLSSAGITQLSGDVTAGPGSGSQTATIPNDTITFAKMQNLATQTLIGRNTAGTGDPEAVTISQALDWL